MPRTRAPAAYLIRRRWTIADARSAVSALKASGLSTCAFAAREGLDVNRLYRWRRRLEAERIGDEPAPKFVELQPRGAEPVEVVLRSGRVLRVSEAIEPAALLRLVTALERTGPCACPRASESSSRHSRSEAVRNGWLTPAPLRSATPPPRMPVANLAELLGEIDRDREDR